jgi:hypothetical protein
LRSDPAATPMSAAAALARKDFQKISAVSQLAP